MPAAPVDAATAARQCAVAVLSARARFGLKGPEAAAWLQARGVDLPAGVNTWAGQSDGALVARLGRSEFLIADGPVAGRSAGLAEALGDGTDGCWPVLRSDACLLLAGERVPELLAQTCNVDLRITDPAARAVTMTSVAGVAVTAAVAQSAPAWRVALWHDPSFATYLHDTLGAIAAELGGGPCALAALETTGPLFWR